MSKKASNPEPDSARPAPPPAPPERVMRCTTHHHACDCREYEFEKAKARIQALEKAAREVVGFYAMNSQHPSEAVDALAALLEAEK